VAALLATPEALAALAVAELLPVVALIGVVHEKKCCAGKYIYKITINKDDKS
jgi:hypothetical protein